MMLDTFSWAFLVVVYSLWRESFANLWTVLFPWCWVEQFFICSTYKPCVRYVTCKYCIHSLAMPATEQGLIILIKFKLSAFSCMFMLPDVMFKFREQRFSPVFPFKSCKGSCFLGNIYKPFSVHFCMSVWICSAICWKHCHFSIELLLYFGQNWIVHICVNLCTVYSVVIIYVYLLVLTDIVLIFIAWQCIWTRACGCLQGQYTFNYSSLLDFYINFL